MITFYLNICCPEFNSLSCRTFAMAIHKSAPSQVGPGQLGQVGGPGMGEGWLN